MLVGLRMQDIECVLLALLVHRRRSNSLMFCGHCTKVCKLEVEAACHKVCKLKAEAACTRSLKAPKNFLWHMPSTRSGRVGSH